MTAKVAWIVGGGSGIGLAGASALAASGWRVIISGRRKDVLDRAASGLGASAQSLVLDVNDADAAANACREILGSHSRIDLLVNSATRQPDGTRGGWAHLDVAMWNEVVHTNLNGLAYATYAVLPSMRAQKSGTVINIASWAGRFITPVGPGYTAAKHAVVALTHSLNVAEAQNGIRACAICPGEVSTGMLDTTPNPPTDAQRANMLQPEDIGDAIAWVANAPPRVCINEILMQPVVKRGPQPPR